jgi:multidrug resistance efflux pump
MDAPTTAQEIKAAYRRLKDWTETTMICRKELALAQNNLKAAEGQVWAGSNETERKAQKMAGTERERLAEYLKTAELASNECELALARLALDEIHDLMRLAEWHNGPYFQTQE